MCNPALNGLGLTDKNHVCNCGADGHAHHSGAAHGGADVIREHYLVNGMTCDHCVASVTEELSAVDGVESVRVALEAGGTSRVMVVSSKPVEVDDIKAAISDAGYELVTA
jgi:copper chaperone